MIQYDDQIAQAFDYALKAETIMTQLGHTKYTLGGLVSKQMLCDTEREVSELLGKIANLEKQVALAKSR